MDLTTPIVVLLLGLPLLLAGIFMIGLVAAPFLAMFESWWQFRTPHGAAHA